jgi:hypothetical protein
MKHIFTYYLLDENLSKCQVVLNRQLFRGIRTNHDELVLKY